MHALEPEVLRTWLTQKVLAWAATLPRFRGGVIGHLQQIVEHNRAAAQRDKERCRPADGANIEFRHFRLIELFPIEDLDAMVNGLRELFPAEGKHHPYQHYLDEFEERADGLACGGWTQVGTIIRDGDPFLFPSPVRRMPDLPEEVQRISIIEHKLLPSLFAVTADVFLTDKATSRLRIIQGASYSPEVTFHHWNPRKWLSLYSTKGSDAITRDAVTSWIDGLRVRIEVLLKPFACGHFQSMPNDGRSRLPTIETYRLINVPLGVDSEKSVRRPTGWWRSLGFDPSGLESFESTEKLLSWTDGGGFRVARLCLSKAPEAEPGVEYIDSDVLNDILGAFAIHVLIDSLETDLAKARKNAYQHLIGGVPKSAVTVAAAAAFLAADSGY